MNHYYDAENDETLCHEYAGQTAWSVSSNGRVSCPDCWNNMTPNERKGDGDWYGRDEEVGA